MLETKSYFLRDARSPIVRAFGPLDVSNIKPKLCIGIPNELIRNKPA